MGPQIDPKDIDTLETERGSYAADVGDRTYGVFDVLPRNGFEFNRDGELLLYGGNPYTAQAQLSLGNHSEKTAWYASATGSRSNYGLATPVPTIYHDATNSESGFVSVIRNQTPKDQLRVDGQLRQDFFRVPYDPSQTDYECASDYYCSYGLRDGQTERDSFVIANWVHTISPKATFSVAPFYHWNQSNYDSNPADMPVATTWHQNSNYAGAQADGHFDLGWNSFSGGLYSFYQKENDLFGVQVNDGSGPSQPNTPANANAGLVEFYVGRPSAAGSIRHAAGRRALLDLSCGSERNCDLSAYRRDGADSAAELGSARILRTLLSARADPHSIKLGAELRGQPGRRRKHIHAVPSERDEEHQFGIEIPYRGWMLDVDTFKNRVNNFLDHSNLGESNMYFPIAVDGALVRAWEMTLRSPELGAYRPVPRGLLEPDRRAARQYYRRIYLQYRNRSGMRSGTGLFRRGPRSARHAEHGLYGEPAATHVVRNQRVLRVGVHQWPSWLRRRTVSRRHTFPRTPLSTYQRVTQSVKTGI